MRKIAILCLASLFLSGCSNSPSDTGDSPDAKTSESKNDTNASAPAETEAKKIAEAKRIAAESNEAMENLAADFETQTKEWEAKFEAATDPEEKKKLLETRPQITFGKQFIELAQKYPGTATSAAAWNMAVENGAGENQVLATQTVLDAAQKLEDVTEQQGQFVFLMNKGAGPARDQAMELLLATAEKKIESPESFELLKQIVQTPGGNAPKSKAVKQLKQFIDADKQSEKAVECMDLIYRHGPISSRSVMLQELLDSHINHDRMIDITSELSEKVDKGNELLLQEICEKSTGKAQANALITLSKFYVNRVEATKGIADLNEEQLKQLNPEQVEYLKAEHDMQPVNQLAEKLKAYVATHTPLIESATAELKVLEGLGKEPVDTAAPATNEKTAPAREPAAQPNGDTEPLEAEAESDAGESHEAKEESPAPEADDVERQEEAVPDSAKATAE